MKDNVYFHMAILNLLHIDWASMLNNHNNLIVNLLKPYIVLKNHIKDVADILT